MNKSVIRIFLLFVLLVGIVRGQAPAKKSESEAARVGLKLHNEYRGKHGAPPLHLDLELSEQAEIYARSVLNQNKQYNLHGIRGTIPPPTKKSGRNVNQIGGPVGSPEDAVKESVENWYGQKSHYNWTDPLSSDYEAKLFSQLVWKSSTALGVGVVSDENKKGETIVVCLYAPPGNVKSLKSYKENVLPAQ